MENKAAEVDKGERTLKILLVEDNEDDVELAMIAFRRAQGNKIDIHTVKNGEEVFKYLGGEEGYQDRETYPRPDLILLDIRMPKMDGFEVLKKLKHADSPNRMIPVTMLTSSSTDSDIDQSYGCGAASYLKKPVTMDEFVVLTSSLARYWKQVTFAE